jgi:hypothetical protein
MIFTYFHILFGPEFLHLHQFFMETEGYGAGEFLKIGAIFASRDEK